MIAEKLKQYHASNIVIDPVMVSTSGSKLISNEAIETLVAKLLPLGTVLTPNIPETEVLCGFAIKTESDMGYCYEYGIGVEKDLQKAVAFYQEVSDEGVAQGQCALGFCYENGIGVEPSAGRAFELYLQAAEQGDAPAQCNLGYFYNNGIGTEKDAEAAIEWLAASARQRYPRAQLILGELYEMGDGLPKDLHKALRLYQLAAKAGYSPAQYKLGLMHYHGFGVKGAAQIFFSHFAVANETTSGQNDRITVDLIGGAVVIYGFDTLDYAVFHEQRISSLCLDLRRKRGPRKTNYIIP